MWRGPGNADSSDEEWETAFGAAAEDIPDQADGGRDEGIQAGELLQHRFQEDLNSFLEMEERFSNIAMDSLEAADNIASAERPAMVDMDVDADAAPADRAQAGASRPIPDSADHGRGISTAEDGAASKARFLDGKALEDSMTSFYPKLRPGAVIADENPKLQTSWPFT